jgi:uncharacterized membrane protein YkgB
MEKVKILGFCDGQPIGTIYHLSNSYILFNIKDDNKGNFNSDDIINIKLSSPHLEFLYESNYQKIEDIEKMFNYEVVYNKSLIEKEVIFNSNDIIDDGLLFDIASRWMADPEKFYVN